MDKKLFLIAIVVLASGCVDSTETNPSSSGSGLEIDTLDISDDRIGPGQTGLITLKLTNYHEKEIDLKDVSIYNSGILNVKKRGCTPSELERARKGYIPGMECKWTVGVPEDAVNNFDSKTIPVKLNLEYSSQLSNSKNPVKTDFRPLSEISTTEEIEKTFSNNEVRMTVDTKSPIPFNGRTITVTAENAGKGRVDSDFRFEYFPEEVFQGCKERYEPVVDQKVEFTCDIVPRTDAEQTRNLILSTSYKYVKAPTLDIEVVDTT